MILQNRSAYITLFIGILFANILLLFGLIMPPVLDNFKTEVLETKLAGYQYILKTPTLTENESAEPFCLASLEYDAEEISVYGIKADSKYAGFPISRRAGIISSYPRAFWKSTAFPSAIR